MARRCGKFLRGRLCGVGGARRCRFARRRRVLPHGLHFAYQPGEVLAGGLQRAFRHRAPQFLAAQRRGEFLDLLVGGLLLGGPRCLQRGDAVGERGVGIRGLRERGFVGGEGARQRLVALHIGRAGLVGLLVFGFVLDERGLQIGYPLMQGIALGRDFAVAPFVFADLFGAREQQFARVGHHLFERRRARLQRVRTACSGR